MNEQLLSAIYKVNMLVIEVEEQPYTQQHPLHVSVHECVWDESIQYLYRTCIYRSNACLYLFCPVLKLSLLVCNIIYVVHDRDITEYFYTMDWK